MTTSCVFITFWLRYHNLLFSSICANVRADSKVNHCWVSAVQRWKSKNLELRNSALNSADLELILLKAAVIFWVLKSADSRWSGLKQRCSALIFFIFCESALISAEKRQIFDTALSSADYLWDFNAGTTAIRVSLNWFILLFLWRVEIIWEIEAKHTIFPEIIQRS